MLTTTARHTAAVSGASIAYVVACGMGGSTEPIGSCRMRLRTERSVSATVGDNGGQHHRTHGGHNSVTHDGTTGGTTGGTSNASAVGMCGVLHTENSVRTSGGTHGVFTADTSVCNNGESNGESSGCFSGGSSGGGGTGSTGEGTTGTCMGWREASHSGSITGCHTAGCGGMCTGERMGRNTVLRPAKTRIERVLVEVRYVRSGSRNRAGMSTSIVRLAERGLQGALLACCRCRRGPIVGDQKRAQQR